MLEDLDLQHIGVAAAVIGPHVLLAEAHAVQRLRRQPVAHLRQLLRVGEAAAQALDGAGVAADVERRADMPERRGRPYFHPFPYLKARRHGRGILGHELRLHTSSILRPSSSVVMMPRWMSAWPSAITQRS